MAATPTGVPERLQRPRGDLAPVPGEVIVRFKAGASVMRAHVLSAGARAETVADVLARRAGTMGARIGQVLEAGVATDDRTQVMRAAGVDTATLIAKLSADPDVEYVEVNGRQHLLAAPNDPLYAALAAGVRSNGPDSGQWYLRAPTQVEVSGIDIETAWAQTTGSSSVVVADLDTGVRPDHPDLAGARLLGGYDFVSNVASANDSDGRDADPSDPGDWVSSADVVSGSPLNQFGCTSADITSSSWHGSSTASIIGANTNDSQGMAGAAPGISILPLRVLGKCGGTDADIQAAMRWAAGISVPGVPDNPRPAKVLNMSLGSTGSCSAGYQSAVNDVLATGAVIVAAAGNTEGKAVGTPANCTGVIAVLALRHAGTKVGFSDLGPQIAISAPGGNCINVGSNEPCLYPILAATNTGAQGPVASSWSNSYEYTVGTSFAAPLVAGTAALMFSAKSDLTPAQVRSILQSTARAFPSTGADNGPGDPTPVTACKAPSSAAQDQCYCPNDGTLCGAGMLNAGAAVVTAAGFVPPPTLTLSASNTSPVAGTSVTLTATATPASGRTIASYAWQITVGSGIASLVAPSNAASVTLATTATGNVTVQATVVDSGGGSTVQTLTLAVQPLPVDPVPTASSSGGGGATSLSWLLGLALAVAGLAVGSKRRR